MSTDWIKVHDRDLVYLAKVFLTDDDNAYMITIQNSKERFFKVDASLLKSGELEFFEKVMESAKEMHIEMVVEMGFLNKRKEN